MVAQLTSLCPVFVCVEYYTPAGFSSQLTDSMFPSSLLCPWVLHLVYLQCCTPPPPLHPFKHTHSNSHPPIHAEALLVYACACMNETSSRAPSLSSEALYKMYLYKEICSLITSLWYISSIKVQRDPVRIYNYSQLASFRANDMLRYHTSALCGVDRT